MKDIELSDISKSIEKLESRMRELHLEKEAVLGSVYEKQREFLMDSMSSESNHYFQKITNLQKRVDSLIQILSANIVFLSVLITLRDSEVIKDISLVSTIVLTTLIILIISIIFNNKKIKEIEDELSKKQKQSLQILFDILEKTSEIKTDPFRKNIEDTEKEIGKLDGKLKKIIPKRYKE